MIFSFVLCTDPAKVIRTELSLLKEEFDSYKINQQADITFCLKELRVRIFCCKI